MAAAVPVVADILVSALISKAASAVISSVAEDVFNMNPGDANLLGAIGGIAAGAYSYGTASDAMNAGKAGKNLVEASSQAGQLAEQTAEFGQAGAEATQQALAYANPKAATSVTPLMKRYSRAAGDLSANPVQPLKDSETANPAGAGPSTGAQPENTPLAEGLEKPAGVAEAQTGSQVAGVKPPEVAKPWYERLWDSDKTGDVLGGAVQGMSGALLQADAQQSLLDQKRDQQLEDERRQLESWKRANSQPGVRLSNSMLNSRMRRPLRRPLMGRTAG